MNELKEIVSLAKESIIAQAKENYRKSIAGEAAPRKKYCFPIEEAEAQQYLYGEYVKGVSARRFLPFINDMETADRIRVAAKWATNQDCKPWLLIYGPPSSGKTILANAIKSMAEELKKAFDADLLFKKRCDAAKAYIPMAKEEEKLLNAFANAVIIPRFIKADDIAGILSKLQSFKLFDEAIQEYDRIKRSRFLIIDDMGEELVSVKVSGGNEYFPLIDILNFRYKYMLPTIITSNLPLTTKDTNGQSIETRYGKRIEGRMAEMCETVLSIGDYRHRR